MCHNSLSEPCPHLVRLLMGISIIGIPITTPTTSLLRISSLLTSYPEMPPGPKQFCLEQMSNTIRLRSKHPQTLAHIQSASPLHKCRCCCFTWYSAAAFSVLIGTVWWAFGEISECSPEKRKHGCIDDATEMKSDVSKWLEFVSHLKLKSDTECC